MLFCTHGCPFTAKYVPLVEAAAKEAGIAFRSRLFDSRVAAQNAPAAWTNYALLGR